MRGLWLCLGPVDRSDSKGSRLVSSGRPRRLRFSTSRRSLPSRRSRRVVFAKVVWPTIGCYVLHPTLGQRVTLLFTVALTPMRRANPNRVEQRLRRPSDGAANAIEKAPRCTHTLMYESIILLLGELLEGARGNLVPCSAGATRFKLFANAPPHWCGGIPGLLQLFADALYASIPDRRSRILC